MTARSRPEYPAFASPAERQVWEQLRQALPADAFLLPGIRILDDTLDHEADLVVLLPDAGVVVLEIKGGRVWTEAAADGEVIWRQGQGHRINPVKQAREAMYALRAYVERDVRWTRGRIVWSHGVVVPYSTFAEDFETPDCPRRILHDQSDQADLSDRLRAQALRVQQQGRVPDADDLALLAEVVRGRGFVRAAPDADHNLAAAEHLALADQLTADQATLLDVTRLLHRVEIRGGAGTGKTVLALAQARHLAAGRHGRSPQRVALLCYSIGLAEYFKREVARWPHRQRPSFVGTYEELGRSWGSQTGSRDDSDFWERRLPEEMAELAAGLAPGHRFDSIIVDEAQDFADLWWTPLLAALKDEDIGGLYVYSDENQRIFARYGRPPVMLVPLVLDHNLRNTRAVFDSFAPLAPTRMTPQGGEGGAVTFVPAAPDEAVDVADDQVLALLDEGWFPGNIVLLTTGSRHPEQVSLTEHDGQQGYWQTFWDDEVFYGHVLGCKGLERPAVVLCVNDDGTGARATEKLYVGMSRATDRLVVVGDPEVVRRIGGPEVADRLGL